MVQRKGENMENNDVTIEVRALNYRFSPWGKDVLTDLSFSHSGASICGLLGRNGSGKSTLSRLIAGGYVASSGEVLINGHRAHTQHAMYNTCFVGDETAVYDNKLKETLKLWADLRPNWDGEYALKLCDIFGLSIKKAHRKLSRGQKSTFYAILGLASRSPLTIFDEVHLGMDAVAREVFYRLLLEDFTEHPRMIFLSSHLIEEVENLLDSAIFLHQGKIVEKGDVDEIRARHPQRDHVARLTEVLMDLSLSVEQKEAMLSQQENTMNRMNDSAHADALAINVEKEEK